METRNIVILSIVGGLILITGLAFGIPNYDRYQSRAYAENQVIVNDIQIRQTQQLVEVEKQKAQMRIAYAQGIAESQKIINATLTDRYLQHEAIVAQEHMANSPNHIRIAGCCVGAGNSCGWKSRSNRNEGKYLMRDLNKAEEFASLWRRMARKLLRVKAQNIQIAFESELRSELAGVLGAAQAVPIAFGKYHYGDTGQYAVLLEATNLLRIELERLLKGEG